MQVVAEPNLSQKPWLLETLLAVNYYLCSSYLGRDFERLVVGRGREEMVVLIRDGEKLLDFETDCWMTG